MKFNPEKSLFDLGAVRLTAGITLLISLVTAGLITLNSSLVFSLNGEDFNFAIKTFQVPLGILAVGLSIIGIFGANHRSEQTKRQIERTGTQIQLTQSQNLFSNYYKHLEEFDKFCKTHSEGAVNGYKIARPRKLHSQIFPNVKLGDYSISQEFLERLDAEAVHFLAQVNAMNDPGTRFQAMKEIVTQESSIVDRHNFGPRPKSGSEWNEGGVTVFVVGRGIRDFVQAHKETFEFIDEILTFDTAYSTSKIVKDVLDFKTENLNPSGYLSTAPMYVEY